MTLLNCGCVFAGSDEEGWKERKCGAHGGDNLLSPCGCDFSKKVFRCVKHYNEELYGGQPGSVIKVDMPELPEPEEIETNARGGQGSKIGVRYQDAPKALQAVAGVFYEGSKKYAPLNWKKVDLEEHLNHVIEHIVKFLQGDKSEKRHLANAATRALMALELDLERDNSENGDKK